MSQELALARPEVSMKSSFVEGMRAMKHEGLNWLQEVNVDMIEENFDSYVAKLLQAEFLRTNALVPETVFWAVVGDDVVGRISVRHELNASLREEGGHIGYEVMPKFRRRGYASKMLALALEHARTLGITEALLTCDDDNTHSAKVIEKNGGKLAEKKQPRGKKLKRYYWIKL